MEEALADLLGLERSGVDFARDRVLNVVIALTVGLRFGAEDARMRLAQQFRQRAPETERAERIAAIIEEGERPT